MIEVNKYICIYTKEIVVLNILMTYVFNFWLEQCYVLSSKYRYVLHNEVLVNDGACMRQCSHKIMI